MLIKKKFYSLNVSAVCLHFSRLRASVIKSLLKLQIVKLGVQEKKDVQNSNLNHERCIYLKEVC